MSVHSATCQMSHVQASQSFVQERGLACVLHDMTVSFECTRRAEHRGRASAPVLHGPAAPPNPNFNEFITAYKRRLGQHSSACYTSALESAHQQ